jgi:hypothetical protein
MKFYEDKLYIKMCETAKEIQKLYHNDDKDFTVASKKEYATVWLPRQDQLQEMAFDEELLEDNNDNFISWLWGGTLHYDYLSSQYLLFNSLEQLWLAYVMKIKFNKIWDKQKEEWVTN